MSSYPTYLADVRRTDFSRLDDDGHIYLDYTGSALFPMSLVEEHSASLKSAVLGNPHSENPTSLRATQDIEDTRSAIHTFFNADPREYAVIFTQNASAAIKLVAESFPFERDSQLLLLADNHNSVHGIREFAARKSAAVKYVNIRDDMRADQVSLFRALNTVRRKRSALPRFRDHTPANLFAYPAQSNFSGVKHPLSWLDAAHTLGWFTLLDAAAFTPSSKLDLSRVKPTFVPVSFYKMFGFPTGVGCLLVRRSVMPKLRRPWFAGGTVEFASVQAFSHRLHSGATAFEDGTLDFVHIPAVKNGLEYLSRLGMGTIADHIAQLTARMLHTLTAVTWSDHMPAVKIYGPTTLVERGGCVSFSLVRHGRRVDPRLVQKSANLRNISLRVGCFCNPGAGEVAMQMDALEVLKCSRKLQDLPVNPGSLSQCLGTPYLGSIRVSVGLANTMSDVMRFVAFLEEFCRTFERESMQDGLQTAPDRILGDRPNRAEGARPLQNSPRRRKRSVLPKRRILSDLH